MNKNEDSANLRRDNIRRDISISARYFVARVTSAIQAPALWTSFS